MEWVPAVKAVVLRVTLPLVRVALPRDAVPFLNVTVPATVPAAEVTVAVKVTASPTVEGVSDETSFVLVGARSTTIETGVEEVPLKSADPP